MIHTVKLIQLFFTSLTAAQGIFYILAGREGLKKVSVKCFAEQRIAIDDVVTPRYKIIYFTILFSGIASSIMLFNKVSSLSFVYVLIATILVFVDLLLAIKINIPINKAFQSYPINNDIDWEKLQYKWLDVISIRGLLSIIAVILLVLSWFE